MVRGTNVSLQGLTVKQACLEIARRLSKYRDAELFLKPVDYIGLELTDYLDIIKRPMDLDTLTKNIQSSMYDQDTTAFWKDIELIWANCELYNGASSIYGKVAQRMREVTRKLHDQFDSRDEVKVKEEVKAPAIEKKVYTPRNSNVQSDESVLASRPPLPTPSDQRVSSIAAAVCAKVLQLNEIAMALIIKYLCSIQNGRDKDAPPIIRNNSIEEREAFPVDFKDDPRQSLRLDIGQLSIKELKLLYMFVERLIEGGSSRV